MRVLHIGKYFPPFAGGMEYFLADLARAQARMGMGVAVLVHDARRGGPGALPCDQDAVAVYRAPSHGRLLYAPVSPAFPLWLRRIIGEFRPDLLHLHMPNTSAFWALATPAARRLPWVVHWHSDVVASTLDPRIRLAYRLYRPFEQRLLARSRAIIATSQTYLNASEALARWTERCTVIPLGLDPARIPAPDARAKAQASRLWGERGCRVLAIGRLTYYKGHEALIRAAADLPDTRVLIVGTGDLQSALARLTQSLGLEDRVSLIGYQSEAILNALLASCDLVCLPSVERTEAFGLVQLEAMRFGKAVVVSDIAGSGTGWVVRHAGNGLLAPPGDPRGLARQLRGLQEDPALRDRLGAAGRLALEHDFGIAPVAARIDGVYQDVLGLARRQTERR
ncbi:glycosyltransferase [Thiocystis violacea]|uniref:glycosyltransferase n=1 Tax=Thiocystis violacea TaxID=13725 RepID=UPI00190511BC|nr:glycosyltransferase [Thiocystis violacea]MBK1722425.1 glycosyl transferase family 1 [Thiocystis violacea]